MGFFKYPYTDLNELNLDWVIAKIKYIEQASHIIYDNAGTGLVSDNVQDAINEIVGLISSQGVASWNGRAGIVVPMAHDYTAAQVDYNNTISGLTASQTQAAIDELAARPLGGVESFLTRTGAVVPMAGDYSAADVTYDNTGSGLVATETQSAINEVNSKIPATIVESFNTRTGAITPAAGDYDAGDITYDNTTSGLTATDAQEAIDELDDRLDNFSVAASQVSYDNTVSGLTATDAQAAIDEIANDVLSSGVASFNGRTGAVNPAAGDYDGSDIDYDNTISGLTATDVQAAIDELASGGASVDLSKTVAGQEGATASRAFGAQEWFIDSSGYLSVTLAAVSSGATWTLNTNYKRMTAGDVLTTPRLLATAVHDGIKTYGDLIHELVLVANTLTQAQKARTFVQFGSTPFLANTTSANMKWNCNDLSSNNALRVRILGDVGGGGKFIEFIVGGSTTDRSGSVAGSDFSLYIN